jgi:hypothetical protein
VLAAPARLLPTRQRSWPATSCALTPLLQCLHALFVMEIQTRDRDGKFTTAFDEVFAGNGTR